MIHIQPAELNIEGLEFHAYHGWHQHEEEFGQPFRLDIKVGVDISTCVQGDALDKTIDYAAIVSTSRELFVNARYKLLETAALMLADGLLKAYPAALWVDLRVRKLSPPIAERLLSVGIHLRLEAGRGQG